MRELSEEEQELALVMCIDRKSFTAIARALDFPNDMAFVRYRKAHPSFDTALKTARGDRCEYLEDDLLAVADGGYDGKVARVKMDSICKLLAFSNPGKYGQRVDVNVTQSLDLSGVLAAANARLPAPEREVEQISNDFSDLV
jgi:hypothetical protein